MSAPKAEIEARRRVRGIIRKASLYTWGFTAAAIGIPVAGAALIAWLLSFAGLPFLDAWLALTIIVFAPTLIGILWRAVRRRTRASDTHTE